MRLTLSECFDTRVVQHAMPAAVFEDLVVIRGGTNRDLVGRVGVVIPKGWKDGNVREDSQQFLRDIPDEGEHLGRSELGVRHVWHAVTVCETTSRLSTVTLYIGIVCNLCIGSKGSSRIVNNIKSVRRVLFFVTPSLPSFQKSTLKMLIFNDPV